MAIRKAINNRNAREGAAVRPYTEILHPTGRQYLLQRRGHYAEIYINPARAALTSNNGKSAPKAREGVAALPYTEFFFSDFGSMISLELRLTERTRLQTKTLRRTAGARYLGTRNAATAIQMVLLTRLRDENRIGCGLNP